MNASEDEIRDQLQANVPEVRTAQVWRCTHHEIDVAYPAHVRIICRYPFTSVADGRLWIVESYPGSLGRIYRIPELTLRVLYDLAEEAPEP